MNITTLFTFLLSAFLVSSLPTIERNTDGTSDFSYILSGISRISSDVSILSNIVANFTGSHQQTDQLANGLGLLESDLDVTLSQAKVASTFSYNDSITVADALRTLTPSVIRLFLAIAQKKPIVTSIGYVDAVHSSLQVLDGKSLDLFSAIENIVYPSLVAAVSPSQQQISAVFKDVIATYA